MRTHQGAEAIPMGTSAAWNRATRDAADEGYAALRAVRQNGAIVDWVVVDANALVRERWAGVVGDVVGTSVSRLDAASDNSEMKAVYERALRTGERQSIDIQLTLPRGKGGWRQVVITPVDDDTVTWVSRDISRERYLEEALHHERRRADAVANRVRDGDSNTHSAGARFARVSATLMLLGAGALTIMNATLMRPAGVDPSALLLTGCIGVALGIAALLLPWDRHYGVTTYAVVGTALILITGGDFFNHYSQTEAALAVYPVFFIVVIAWTGLTQKRGAASAVAVASGLGLTTIMLHSGRPEVALQCVVVAIPVGAAMGEVLSWYSQRSRELTNLEIERRLHDPLTGLANRTLLSMRLDHALARARRSGGLVAVCYLDLDGFKEVNDRLGHTAGDELLVEIGARLRSAVRDHDTVARLGGDEFVIVCEDVPDPEIAGEIATRVIHAVAAPVSCGSGEAHVTASVGLALSSDGAHTYDALLHRADTALYRAKGNGRARVEIFDQALQDQMSARDELEQALRLAVPRQELRVHYQPIVSAGHGHTVGFEALVRWERPGYGLLAPDAFIGVAERTGLIVDIGSWVLHTACAQAVAWGRRWPDRRLGISVNLSAHQVLHGDIVERVRETLAATGLEPSRLTLELTESTVIDEHATVDAILTALRDLGVSIAIDDFGTGYSSLTYLRRLPVNVVKIDRSFVRTIGTEREDTAIVSAVIGLAHNLGLATVAEGVENASQLGVLVHLGCEYLQGFLFAKPRPADEIDDVLAADRFRLEALPESV